MARKWKWSLLTKIWQGRQFVSTEHGDVAGRGAYLHVPANLNAERLTRHEKGPPKP